MKIFLQNCLILHILIVQSIQMVNKINELCFTRKLFPAENSDDHIKLLNNYRISNYIELYRILFRVKIIV